MNPKPQIQYVGQFYVYGSEARAVRHQIRKKAKTSLPAERRVQIRVIHVDPAALLGIAASVLLLTAMAVGALRIHTDWKAYEQMKTSVAQLKKEHDILNYRYRNCFEPEELRSKAVGLGLVPAADVKHVSITVTPPEPKTETTWLDDVKWFFDGLLP